MTEKDTTECSKEGVASAEEAGYAISCLSQEDVAKLLKEAQYLWSRWGRFRRSDMDSDDLLGEAVKRTLTHDRKWKPHVQTIQQFLIGCMKSIASSWANSGGKELQLADEILDRADNQVDALLAKEERIASEEEIDRIFSKKPKTLQVLECRINGIPASEICLLLGISRKEYDSLSKWIYRKTKELRKQ